MFLHISKGALKLPFKGGEEMKHDIKISVSKEVPDGGIVSCRTVSFRERFLRRLFGEKRKVTIIVPGESVDKITISECVVEGGEINAT